MRKRWVRPFGTVTQVVSKTLPKIESPSLCRIGNVRTVAIVVQVEDLVAPLCYYAQCILEERHYDEESADSGHVTVMTCQ